MRTSYLVSLIFIASLSALQNYNARAETFTFQDVVKRETPSIVSIRSSSVARGGNSPLKDFFRLGKHLDPEVKEGSLGTGFIIHESGLVLTNHHVIAPPPHFRIVDDIVIRLSDQREFSAVIVGADKKIDVALLRIEDVDLLPSVHLGNSNTLDVGEWVLAIGNPFGIEPSLSVGILSGTGRILGSGPYDQFIQTDAMIHAGNTGGPLYNLKGEVIGMNTTVNMPDIGIGFAIPINMIKKALPMLARDGKITRGWLGVMVQNLTRELAQAFNIVEGKGALVSEVMRLSPAEKAGLMRGDVIVGFDGKEVDKMHDLPTLVAETPVGKTVELEVIRNGEATQLKVGIERLEDE